MTKLPPQLETNLDKIGVRKPKTEKPKPQPADHVPWTANEEPTNQPKGNQP